MEQIVERYPSTGANEAALRVEALSAALGIDLAPRFGGDRRRPSDGELGAYQGAKAALGGYLNQQLERSRADLGPPPEPVATYFALHEEKLEALRRQLLQGDLPEWELQIDEPSGAPIPNLLGHVALHKLLLADALATTQAGGHDVALADLEASWRLNTALRNHPILIAQLIGLTVARMQAGTLRHLEGVPTVWIGRLGEHDFRNSLLRSLQFESWHWLQLDALGDRGGKDSPWSQLAYTVTKPYVRYCTSVLSEEWRRRLVNLSELDYLCDRDLSAYDAHLDLSVPRWNVIGKIIAPTMEGVLQRLARYEVDAELTRKVLEAKAARAANGGRWRQELQGIERSEACPEDGWVYEVTPTGAMTLAFSRQISWPLQRGTNLPTFYHGGAEVLESSRRPPSSVGGR
jgi:hypothetical protein